MMAVTLVSTNLQVDVNGEGMVVVDKNLVSNFSVRLQKLFGKSTRRLRNLKVIFHDFPGGAECFELIAKFCYNQGIIDITSSNVLKLHYAAVFMEMPKLINQTEAFIEHINSWSWPELVASLRQCQDFLLFMKSSHICTILNCLVGMFILPYIDIPSSCSSCDSGLQFSGEISSASSTNSKPQTTWWFEELVFVNVELFEKLIKAMLSHNFDKATTCSFLFYYQKSRLSSASHADKCKIIETSINVLHELNLRYAMKYKYIFALFGMASSCQVSRSSKGKLENLVGSRLDEAAIDNLLVRSPSGKKYAYDANMVIRLVNVFVEEISKEFVLNRVKKVSCLIDAYLAEVAPDPYLKPSKFVVLAMALPDFARDSHDRRYHAMDMYLEVHTGLDEDVKLQIFSAINYKKLSQATLKHLAQNPKFQCDFIVTVFASQLTGLLKGVDNQRMSSCAPICEARKCEIEETDRKCEIEETVLRMGFKYVHY